MKIYKYFRNRNILQMNSDKPRYTVPRFTESGSNNNKNKEKDDHERIILDAQTLMVKRKDKEMLVNDRNVSEFNSELMEDEDTKREQENTNNKNSNSSKNNNNGKLVLESVSIPRFD